MKYEYWFMNLTEEDREIDAEFTIKTLMGSGWEFIANGGEDSADVLIFKKYVGDQPNAMEEDLNLGSINEMGQPLM